MSDAEDVLRRMEEKVEEAVRKDRERRGAVLTREQVKELWDRLWPHRLDEPLPRQADTLPDVFVFYSAYHSPGEVPVDNLHEVPVRGKVRIEDLPNPRCWGRDKEAVFESEVMTDPTWLDLCCVFDRQIQVTKDYHHVFLEGITVARTEGDVSVCRFETGS